MILRVASTSMEINACAGESLYEVLGRAGIRLQAVCAGKGTCGKCRVRLLSGALEPPTTAEQESLSREDLSNGTRLACQAQLTDEDATIEIPGTSVLAECIGLTGAVSIQVETDPATRVVAVELEAPDLSDQRPDAVRLSETLSLPLRNDLGLLRRLPEALPKSQCTVDAVLFEDQVTAVMPVRKDRPVLGLATDIGTTTIALELIDLQSGERLAARATTNPQGVVGADVISRIEHASARPAALQRLKTLLLDAISDLLDDLLQETGFSRQDVFEITAAGNPTMLHLLLGVDPSAIAVVPFIPAFRGPVAVPAQEAGLDLAPGAILYCIPIVSAYVGADIVAGLLVLESLPNVDAPSLFIDVGTNGEIALLTEKGIYSCATAAGPAFEGARISCGMRAVPGAVCGVTVTENGFQLATVDNAAPIGICGSGLIDAVAALLETGLLEPAGAFVEAAKAPPHVRASLKKTNGGEPAAELASKVVLTQRDIRELQLAKGAIQAGAGILLRDTGISPDEIAAVYLAGAFGSFINPMSAVRIGLVPQGIRPEKLDFLGNTSLAGARMTLLSKSARSKAEHLSRSVKYVELSGRPDFQGAFAEAMFFPEGQDK